MNTYTLELNPIKDAAGILRRHMTEMRRNFLTQEEMRERLVKEGIEQRRAERLAEGFSRGFFTL